LGERVQQEIERQARTVTRLGLRKAKGAASDRKIASRRDDIEMIALERHPVCSLLHGHRGVTSQQIHHHAFVGGIKMLHQDEGHAGSGRQRADELPARIEAACRGAHTNNREVSSFGRRSARRNSARTGSRSGRFGLTLTIFWHLPMVHNQAPPGRAS